MTLELEFSKDKPLYTTSVVASLLDITPDRLRTYDAEKLIHTHRVTTGQVQKRLYSQYDVEWLKYLRVLVKNNKMSISSVKILLKIIYQNSNLKFPKGEVGDVLALMIKNPNFIEVVKNF